MFKTIGNSLKKIIESFKEALKYRPFRKICIATFLIFNAFNTVAAFTILSLFIDYLMVMQQLVFGLHFWMFRSIRNHVYSHSIGNKDVKKNG